MASTFSLSKPDLADWRSGNTGVEGVWQFDSGQPGPTVMISALIHGNELCGAWALKGLLEAGIRPQRGRLILAFCNLAAFDRFDAASPDSSRFVEQDLNRQWTPERLQIGASLEARRAKALEPFVMQTDWLLDLHSMHEAAAPLLLSGMQARNLELARALRSTEYVVVDSGHVDGVRMRDYGRFGDLCLGSDNGTRSLLIECGFHGDPSSRTVAQDICVRFLAHSKALDAQALATALPGWQQNDVSQQWALDVTGPIVAKSENFRFVEPYKGLEIIARAGTVIGWNDDEAVITPHDNCVLVMPSTRQARPGVTVVRFARRRDLLVP